MTEKVEFGDSIITQRSRKYPGLTLFPPQQNGYIIIRFVGTQQKIYQRWNKGSRSFSFSNSHQEGYSVRVVSFVIDRCDDRVKAFMCPVSIWNQVGAYSKDHDFKIRREGMGLNSKYPVDSLGETEVSQDLLDRIEITSQVYTLSDIFINKIKWELLNKDHEPINSRFDILDL